jgi:hypothetical protein
MLHRVASSPRESNPLLLGDGVSYASWTPLGLANRGAASDPARAMRTNHLLHVTAASLPLHVSRFRYPLKTC